jgi:hypothetical protein
VAARARIDHFGFDAVLAADERREEAERLLRAVGV